MLIRTVLKGRLAPMRSTLRALVAPSSLVLLALVGAGCSASVDTSPSLLPTPSIAVGSAFSACTAPGSTASLSLSDVGTRVTLGSPGSLPVNRVDAVGTATGLGPSDVVHVVIIPIGANCPVLQDRRATVAADGTFSAQVDLTNLEDFRIIAFALPDDTLPVVGCATAGAACVDTSGVAPSGVANTLEVRLE